MKLSIRSLAIAVTACLFSGAASIQAAPIIYKLDFGTTVSPVTTGFTAVGPETSWTVIPSLTLNNISGVGGSATINATFGNFRAGDAGPGSTQPLTTDGFYIPAFGSAATFTFSNLTEGSTVDLYGISAWYSNVSNDYASRVTFGNGTAVAAATIGDPVGTAPTRANFTYIGSAVVGISGSLSGSFQTGLTDEYEGQLGGLWIEVTAIPEPSTLAMLLGGVGLLAFRRRMRRS